MNFLALETSIDNWNLLEKWSREDGTNARADHLVCFRVCSPSISAPSEQSASMCCWPVAIQVCVVIAWIRKSTALATDPTSKVLSVGSLISLISLSCWYSEKKSKWKNPLSGHIWEACKPDWVNLFLVNFPESLHACDVFPGSCVLILVWGPTAANIP